MNLEEYLKVNCAAGVIDHSIRAAIGNGGNPRFYIHPANVSGETLDFVVTKNQLHPANIWDGMQELSDTSQITPELRAKLDAQKDPLIAWLKAEMDLDEIAKINARDHGQWDRYHSLEGHRQGLLHVIHHLRAERQNDKLSHAGPTASTAKAD